MMLMAKRCPICSWYHHTQQQQVQYSSRYCNDLQRAQNQHYKHSGKIYMLSTSGGLENTYQGNIQDCCRTSEWRRSSYFESSLWPKGTWGLHCGGERSGTHVPASPFSVNIRSKPKPKKVKLPPANPVVTHTEMPESNGGNGSVTRKKKRPQQMSHQKRRAKRKRVKRV